MFDLEGVFNSSVLVSANKADAVCVSPNVQFSFVVGLTGRMRVMTLQSKCFGLLVCIIDRFWIR